MPKCEHCGEEMEHLCADVYTCEECLVIKSFAPDIIEILQSSASKTNM